MIIVKYKKFKIRNYKNKNKKKKIQTLINNKIMKNKKLIQVKSKY